MPTFVRGLQLSEAFYREAVAPVLAEAFPRLPYSAALIGTGSEVLAYDTERSTDHHWGPRLLLFLTPADHERYADAIGDLLAERLPTTFRGYSTHFGPPDSEGVRLPRAVERGPVAHRVEPWTVERFMRHSLGFDPRGEITLHDWLLASSQALLSVTAGAVFHDDLGELGAIRERLRWYPHDLWLYLIACGWRRISQEEAFVGRCGEVGDDLGSRIVAARLVRDVMRLCFLFERRYAPYSKWLGTAFRRLECAVRMGSVLEEALAVAEWTARERHLAHAYEIAGTLHNELGLTETVDPSPRPYHSRPFLVLHAERFTEATRRAISDARVRALTADVGAVDQFADSTDVLSYAARARRLRAIYDDVG